MVAVAIVLARAARWDSRDVAGRARDLWVAARMASARVPAGGIRVSQARPRRLGVHAAISVPGVPDEVLPEYVPRDADAGEAGVRAEVTAAAQRGGFVLLVGGSSAGKSRSAFEAVTALLPDWWLVHPAGPGDVAALAAAPTARTVVWLDELQRYLDGERGLTGGVIRALLDAPDPVVIIGTIWPDRYGAYTALPAPGGADPHAQEREVLDLANVVRIAPEFSPAEQGRAQAAAARDARLRVALGVTGYGLTQTLAAAPQLVTRWADAKAAAPYAWAVLTAALDAASLGARAPLTADLLRAAAPGYCTSQQQAEAPESWFEQALAYATAKLVGAASALSPAGAGMGEIAGYVVADYLLQQASGQRRHTRVPASTWDAVVSYIHDPADAVRLAGSARDRMLYRYAIPLYRRAADTDDAGAAAALAELLARRGGLEEAEQVLRPLADAGHWVAALTLTNLLARHGDLDGAEQVLRAAAEVGVRAAASQLAGLLAQRGDLDGLRGRARAGDGAAAVALAGLLARRGRPEELEEAEQVLRPHIGVGDEAAVRELASLQVSQLALHGDLDALRDRADAGDETAAVALADLLIEHDDLQKAEQVLRPHADAGAGIAAARLADLLEDRGDLDGLRERADAGDGVAAEQLADLLAERGDLEEAEQQWRARADVGDGASAERLAELLAARGDLSGLRERADAGDTAAAWELARLLADREDLDGLLGRVAAGDTAAAEPLINLLTRQDRGEEAERLRRFGLNPDGSIASA